MRMKYLARGFNVFVAGQTWADTPWSDYWWYPVQLLVKGDHPGQIEGREKCIRPDGVDISEFDGQTSVCMLGGAMYLFARSNPAVSGHRSVQSVKILFDPNIRKGQPGHMSVFRFRMCAFDGFPCWLGCLLHACLCSTPMS